MKLPTSWSDAIAIGSPRYRTGKPCKHGHIADRVTLNGMCSQCAVDRAAARRAKVREALDKAREALDKQRAAA